MKRIIFAISALAVIAGLSASCQKEMVPDNNSASVNTGLTVTATIADNGTKVSYEEDASLGLIPTWEVNDIVIGFDGDENTYGYKVTAVNEGVATLAIITSGDFAGTATSDPADGTTMYMFYAPGTKPSAINTTEKSLTVSLASQSTGVVPALMMAQATVAGSSLNLSFKNKTAIIGIKTPTMACVNKSYTGIAVSGAGINTEVKFGLNASSQLEATYQTPGTIVKAMGSITSGTDKKISETVYVVACPLTTAADLTFTASNGESFTKTGKTMTAGNYYYMTPTFLAPPAALSGEFTVGPTTTDKVRFSPGNLRCNPVGAPGAYTSGIWSFFDKQYECGPSSYTLGHDKEISLFTWGYNATKSINPAGQDSNNVSVSDGNNLSQEQDWGSQIGDGSTWRTLTTAEWKYLFNTRADASSKVGFATVGGVEGIIILPDTFTDPMKNNGSAAFAPKSSTGWAANIYTIGGNWEAMETAGAVFLPAAGYRTGSGVDDVGDGGCYWSSTVLDSDRACSVYFISNYVFPNNLVYRSYGYSVRLITESK